MILYINNNDIDKFLKKTKSLNFTKIEIENALNSLGYEVEEYIEFFANKNSSTNLYFQNLYNFLSNPKYCFVKLLKLNLSTLEIEYIEKNIKKKSLLSIEQKNNWSTLEIKKYYNKFILIEKKKINNQSFVTIIDKNLFFLNIFPSSKILLNNNIVFYSNNSKINFLKKIKLFNLKIWKIYFPENKLFNFSFIDIINELFFYFKYIKNIKTWSILNKISNKNLNFLKKYDYKKANKNNNLKIIYNDISNEWSSINEYIFIFFQLLNNNYDIKNFNFFISFLFKYYLNISISINNCLCSSSKNKKLNNIRKNKKSYNFLKNLKLFFSIFNKYKIFKSVFYSSENNKNEYENFLLIEKKILKYFGNISKQQLKVIKNYLKFNNFLNINKNKILNISIPKYFLISKQYQLLELLLPYVSIDNIDSQPIIMNSEKLIDYESKMKKKLSFHFLNNGFLNIETYILTNLNLDNKNKNLLLNDNNSVKLFNSFKNFNSIRTSLLTNIKENIENELNSPNIINNYVMKNQHLKFFEFGNVFYNKYTDKISLSSIKKELHLAFVYLFNKNIIKNLKNEKFIFELFQNEINFILNSLELIYKKNNLLEAINWKIKKNNNNTYSLILKIKKEKYIFGNISQLNFHKTYYFGFGVEINFELLIKLKKKVKNYYNINNIILYKYFEYKDITFKFKNLPTNNILKSKRFKYLEDLKFNKNLKIFYFFQDKFIKNNNIFFTIRFYFKGELNFFKDEQIFLAQVENIIKKIENI